MPWCVKHCVWRATLPNVPKKVKDTKLKKKEEMIAQHSSRFDTKVEQQKNVTMISAYHRDETHTVSKRGK
jgi:hypothetical protein